MHGENAISIAAIFEFLQLPNHPFHAQAVARAAAFIKAEKDIQGERSAEIMRESLASMTEVEWSRIVD